MCTAFTIKYEILLEKRVNITSAFILLGSTTSQRVVGHHRFFFLSLSLCLIIITHESAHCFTGDFINRFKSALNVCVCVWPELRVDCCWAYILTEIGEFMLCFDVVADIVRILTFSTQITRKASMPIAKTLFCVQIHLLKIRMIDRPTNEPTDRPTVRPRCDCITFKMHAIRECYWANALI